MEEKENIRTYHVGQSNYSSMPEGYQPWDIWKVYHLNPWDADIIKRVLRTKTQLSEEMQEKIRQKANMKPSELKEIVMMDHNDSRIMDYEKIIHICKERINQLKEGYQF